MLRFLADENFDQRIIRGLLARAPLTDVVTVQDAGLSARRDQELLAWAANQRRVLLTHDVTTMTGYAYERIAGGQPMPGVFAVHQTVAIGQVIDDLVLLAEASYDDEWEGQVRYLLL